MNIEGEMSKGINIVPYFFKLVFRKLPGTTSEQSSQSFQAHHSIPKNVCRTF